MRVNRRRGGRMFFVPPQRKKAALRFSESKCGHLRIASLSAQIHHVHIRAEAHVIRQVPAHVIGIVIDHNLVRVPQPVTAITDIHGRDAEIKPAEPETSRSAPPEMPHVTGPEAAAEMSMLPR